LWPPDQSASESLERADPPRAGHPHPAQRVGHGAALDDQGLVHEHNLADHLDVKVIAPDFNVSRQRASNGARQSSI
jgi:hypothetical protein